MNAVRIVWKHIIAVPLSIIAFVVVATCLIFRSDDGNPYIEDADDDADPD